MRHKQTLKSRKLKVKNIRAITFLTFIFSLSTLSAQEVIPATGGNASGSGGSVDYSAGQVIYTTNTGTTGSVAHGVQQPYEISVVTGIEEAKNVNLLVNAYPNTTTDYLILKVDNFEISNLSFQLYDMSGNLLESKKIAGNETSINISHLLPAIYFLRVVENKRKIMSFKIIKY